MCQSVVKELSNPSWEVCSWTRSGRREARTGAMRIGAIAENVDSVPGAREPSRQ